MASTRQTRSMTASSTTTTPSKALQEFRTQENQDSDASDSEPEPEPEPELVRSQRNESPEKIEGKRTKSKKKRERRKVGALTDGLGDLLAGALKSGEGEGEGSGVSAGAQANGDRDEVMDVEVEAAGVGKKMNKRTRQNLLKMEARRQQKLANKQREMIPEPTIHQVSHPMAKRPLDAKKKATDARRARKERARMVRKVGEGERMDLG
ncbi:hypothetical protein NX059_007149 [Plenodomus lindquistii]|nr:hypothetical protein NX059_007149 [Plenodomus lindquistii]